MSQDCLKKILVVEDQSHWQLTLSSLLSRAGYETIAVFDERDLFVQLRDMKEIPILALVDLELLWSGYVSEEDQLRQDDRLAGGKRVLDKLRSMGIYVIVLSAHVPKDETFFQERPEIRGVVDKMRFAESDFETFFLKKLETAVSYAEAARYAEGKMPDQQKKP